MNRYIRDWFTNWEESDLPLAQKLAVTARNLARRGRLKSCCGHHGEPGC